MTVAELLRGGMNQLEPVVSPPATRTRLFFISQRTQRRISDILYRTIKNCETMDRLSAMEAFVRVVETGSFSSAARLLGMGQPAVSKAVRQLEDRLGVRLLLRTTHGLTPTEAGMHFHERAKRSIEEAEEADLAARGAASTLTGRLRICAAVTFARLHVVPRLKTFMAEYPELGINVILDDRNVDLVEAGIDVALRMGDLSDSTLTARRLGSGSRLVVATPEYLAEFGTPVMPQDLQRHQAVIYDQRGGGTSWTFTNGLHEISVDIDGRLQATAAEAVREAVFAGLGLAVSSEWMFADALASGRVVATLTDWALPDIDLWAVFPSNRRANAKAKAFTAFIEAKLFSPA